MAYLLWHYLTESVRRHPTRPAVSWRETSLTYAELDELSTRLARTLMACGLERGSRVGLFMPKSARSVVTMLAVLKSGATYVPIDPAAPASRVAYILRDCGVRGLVSTSRHIERLGEVLPGLGFIETVILTDDDPADVRAALPKRVVRWADIQRTPLTEKDGNFGGGLETDPAYLLYTSGSTGNPKGVILSHRNALTFVDWAAEIFSVEAGDRLSGHAPLHFDLSVFDIYAALRAGACVVMVPDEVAPFPLELARWIEAERISVWYSVPSALTRLLLHGQLERFKYDALRTVLYAGEVFPVKYLRQCMSLLGRVEFYNLYGPTETNVCTYFKLPRPLGPEVTDIPIGRACENTEVWAMDPDGRVVRPGETGELYVRGPSVMPGYWNLPEKAKEVLVSNPLQPAFNELVYRTGDLVRLEADGCYRFIGRRDHMIKSRGYRIELGEIERALHDHPGVKEAVVLAVPDDEIGARLLAVVVPHTDGSLDPKELQAFCLVRLPKYMVPEEMEFRQELPRTSTGKADRMALMTTLGTTVEEARRT